MSSTSSFPQLFERVLVPAIFRPWAEDFLDRIKPASVERILDVGCGTGIVARLMRERCGAETRIVGVDSNPEMIEVARSISPDIDWHQGNALQLPFESSSFELSVCQQALQFFPDRAAGVREMRRVLASHGRIALSTWRPLGENPLYFALNQLAAARFEAGVDRRFSFGDAQAIHALLEAAGFRDIRVETVTRDECMPDLDSFVVMNLGATVDGLDELPFAERAQLVAQFQAEARTATAPFIVGDAVVHPVSANVITASL